MNSIVDTIFKSLLFDENYARSVVPYLDDSCFDGSYRKLFKMYKTLFDEYNTIPTIDAISVLIEKSSISEDEFSEIAACLTHCYDNRKDLPNTDFLIKETEEYCRDKKIYEAIYQSLSIIEGKDKNRDAGSIPDMLADALSISFDTTLGMEFFDDAEARYELYTAEDSRLQFPLKTLNRMMGGGAKKKGLMAVLAGTNVGKSALMCFLAGEFLKMGKNVVYLSLEMAEEDIHERIEANLLSVKTEDLKKLTKEQYLSKVNKIKSKTHGRLYVKEYPTGSAHTGHFRHFLKELRTKKKFVPDIIFVDYINIMASSRYKASSGINSYSLVKSIAEELRGLSMELGVPIMTGTQVNRSGMKEDSTPDMTDTSDSFGLPMSLDFFFSMHANDVLRDNNQQLLTCIKTRWGNKQKQKPELIGIDWDYMRYYDLDSTTDIASRVGKNKPKEREGETPEKPSGLKKRKSNIDLNWE